MDKTSKDQQVPLPIDGVDTHDRRSLAMAKMAFKVGNYRRVRSYINAMKDSGDAEAKRRAAQLMRRISVDPVHIASLFVCLALFLGIVIIFAQR